jgi:FHS family L-fucose permease-like MFS transporter
MEKNQDYKKAFILLTSLFFMWGFITVMNDVLVNTFKDIFDLTPTERSLVQQAFFGAFFVVSLLYFTISSVRGTDPINRIGYKNGMSISLLICGIGCLSFYPAAMMESYPALLGSLFVLAIGVACLQICANPYATILGSSETASSRLNLAQGFNSLGTTLGPLIGTILIYEIFSTGEETPESVGQTYMVYGAAFIVLALMVRASKMPSFVNEERIEPGLKVLKNRHLTLGIIAIFFYVGAEVAVGTWLVEFATSEKTMALPKAEASYLLPFFWGGLMIGRLMASISLNSNLSKKDQLTRMGLVSVSVFAVLYLVISIKIGKFVPFSEVYVYLICLAVNFLAFILGAGKPAKSLMVFSSINVVLFLMAMFAEEEVALWCLIGTGLFFSIGWSNVFSLAIRGLGKYTSQGSSLLVMAIVGGAFIPTAQSMLIESKGVQFSFIVPAIAMLYLIFYGWNGYKTKEELS